MTITLNGKTFALTRPRLNWTDLSRLASKPNISTLKVTVTRPEGAPERLLFGHRLRVCDGMTIQVT